MKLIKTLTLLAAVLALPACTALTPSTKAPIHLPPLDSKLTTGEGPKKLPQRSLKQAEVEKLWLQDRAELRQCRVQQAGVVSFYNNLRESLKFPQ